MNISVNDKLIYLGAGCGIGLVMGLLFAPRSGQDIRHTLTSKVDDLTHKVGEGAKIGSTRLNSSHLVISYAVFCLKKKKKITIIIAHKSCYHSHHPLRRL